MTQHKETAAINTQHGTALVETEFELITDQIAGKHMKRELISVNLFAQWATAEMIKEYSDWVMSRYRRPAPQWVTVNH